VTSLAPDPVRGRTGAEIRGKKGGPGSPPHGLPERPAQGRPERRGLEWLAAQADARALSSSLDPVRLFEGALIAADFLVIVLGAGLAFVLRYGWVEPPPHVGVATGLAVLIMANLSRGSTARTSLPGPTMADLFRVWRCWALTMVCLLVAAYLTRTSDSYARLWASAWFLTGLIGFGAVRLASMQFLLHWRRQGRLARMVAIVDLDGTGRALAARLRTEQRLMGGSADDLRLMGVFAAGSHAARTDAPRSPRIDDLLAMAQLFRIDDVLVTVSWPGDAAMRDVLRRLATLPTTVRLCPVLPQGLPASHGEAELLLGSPTLVVSRRPLSGWHVVGKRAEDLILGSLMLVVLAPLMLLIAAAVRLESPGPALFRQKRLGFNNNPMTVFKFRSMTHAPQREECAVPQATRNDPRVTRLGRLLRRSSLDELPQLLNVLRGDMSLVGPRPHAVAHNVHYAALIDDYLGRHRVQPGITGWAQVNGWRGETDTIEKMQKRVEFDLAYIERWSVMFDLRIILQTALGMFFHRHAY
jgi:putative colanic acid biosynthesis UDP-glucose lipid carrier transferase